MPTVRRARVRSLAKINLDLRILNRRADGFHELRTVFQTISLADTIDIAFTPARRTSLSIQGNVDIPDNLILSAAEAVLGALRVRGEVAFRLEKKIPMGGGLGGGSGNAASVLLALPVLAGGVLPMEKLMQLGAELGSDVPFFLLGGTALGAGRGTELYPLPDRPPARGLVVAPDLHVSTAEAYGGLGRELTFPAASRTINSFQACVWQAVSCAPGRAETAQCTNDFETVVFRKYPQLKSIKGKLLRLGADPALMSGSGCALVGMFRTRLEIERARQSLRNERVYPISLVGRLRYRRLWWKQLREHTEETVWPPRSRYEQ